MTPLTTIAFVLGITAYTVAATLFFLDLARQRGAPAAVRWAPRALAFATGSHATHIVASSLLSRVCPVESLHFALSLSALIAAVVFLAFRRRARMHAIGAFVAPVALTFLVGAQFVSFSQPAENVPRSVLALHVTSNLLGLALFLLAGAASAFYLYQERRLKAKRISGISGKLPPLDALDLTEHRLLLAGFPLLTLGIVSGAVFANQLEHGGSAEVLRAALAYTTWILVAGVLLLRAVAGWRGRRAAYGTLAGVVCVLLVLVVYLVRPGAGGGL